MKKNLSFKKHFYFVLFFTFVCISAFSGDKNPAEKEKSSLTRTESSPEQGKPSSAQKKSSGSKPKKEKVMYVAVEEADVKEKPSFFSKTKEIFLYTQKVIVLETKGNWTKVRLPDAEDKDSQNDIQNEVVQGWISSGSLSKKRIAQGKRLSASTDELALAGKGFSSEIENVYRKNSELDYESVDRIENSNSTNASLDELIDFIKGGKLNFGGGFSEEDEVLEEDGFSEGNEILEEKNPEEAGRVLNSYEGDSGDADNGEEQ